MKRFAVYRDISPTYVLFDRIAETVAGLFLNQRDAERAARRLNDRPPRLASRPLRALVDMRAAARVAMRLNNCPANDNTHIEGGRS